MAGLKLRKSKYIFVLCFILLFQLNYADENLGKLKLDSFSKDDSSYGVYFNAGYFNEISSKGNSVYFSSGVHYRASENIKLRLGLFYDYITGSRLIAINKDSQFFAGFEFGLNYSFLSDRILSPFIGIQLSATLIEEIYNRNALNIGLDFQPWKYISFSPYYSIAHTQSPNLYGFTSHFGGAILTIHF